MNFLGINYSSPQRWSKKNEKHIAHFILNSDNDQTLEHFFECWVSGWSFYLHVLLCGAAEHKILSSVQEEMKLGGFSYPETQTMALMVSSDLQNLQICSESGIMK